MMRVSLTPVSVDYEGTLAVGDRVTIQGFAVVTSVSTLQTPDPTGSRTQTETAAIVTFEDGSPTASPA